MALFKTAPEPIVATRSNMMMAAGFLNSLAVELSQWVRLVKPLENKKKELKQELKEVESSIAEHDNLKYPIVKRALRFWRWAERRKSDFLTGTSKTVKTGSGSFAWKLNSSPSLIYDSEESVIKELEKAGLTEYIVKSIDKEGLKAAVLSGTAKGKTFRVEQVERLVISPDGNPPVTVYRDGRVEFECG